MALAMLKRLEGGDMIHKNKTHRGRGGLRRASDYLRAFDRFHAHSTPTPEAVKRSIPPARFYRCELPDMPHGRAGGWVDGGLCPFHADSQAGSFRVNLDTGAFRCFSCGAHGGDVLAFALQRHGGTFPETLARLAREWGAA
jgi:hypothetical protein